MKTLGVFLFFAVLTQVLSAQITHEKTYDRHVQLVTYPNEPAPKYFSLDTENSEAHYYNLDHSSFKTINIPRVNGILQDFNYLSTNTFDDDNGKEYLVSYRDTADHKGILRVYDNDNSVMLNTEGQYGIVKKIDTGSLALMVYNHDIDSIATKIYRLGGNEVPVDYAQAAPKFRIYPNPATSKITITYGQNNPNESVTFTLFNRWGQEILHKRLRNQNNKASFNVQHLTPGTYIARLEYADGRMNSKSLLILS